MSEGCAGRSRRRAVSRRVASEIFGLASVAEIATFPTLSRATRTADLADLEEGHRIDVDFRANAAWKIST